MHVQTVLALCLIVCLGYVSAHDCSLLYRSCTGCAARVNQRVDINRPDACPRATRNSWVWRDVNSCQLQLLSCRNPGRKLSCDTIARLLRMPVRQSAVGQGTRSPRSASHSRPRRTTRRSTRRTTRRSTRSTTRRSTRRPTRRTTRRPTRRTTRRSTRRTTRRSTRRTTRRPTRRTTRRPTRRTTRRPTRRTTRRPTVRPTPSAATTQAA